MQLGFVSAILPDLSLEEVVSFARASDYECVELMCWPAGKAERRYAGVTHVDVTSLNQRGVEAVVEVTAAGGVAISGLGYYPNPLTPDTNEARASIQHIKKVIRASSKLGIGLVNSFIGRDWTRSVEENWPRFLKVWRPLVQFAEDQGVRTVAVEIGDRKVDRMISSSNRRGDLELAITATAHSSDHSSSGNDQVHEAVPIHVKREDRIGSDTDVDQDPVERASRSLLSLRGRAPRASCEEC